MTGATAIRSACLLICAPAILAASLCATAQQQRGGTNPQSQNQTSTTIGTGISPVDGQTPLDARRDSLTAAQISDILQQRPELIVELKSLLAEQIQQQGGNTLADSISDEQFLQQVALSATVRSTITQWLRARGYLSQFGQPQRSPLDLQEEDELSSLSPDPALDQLTTQLSGTAGSLEMLEASGVPISPRAASPVSNQVPSGTQAVRARTRPDPRAESPKQDQNITDVPSAIRRAAPYNLRSMRDLYTQLPQDVSKLKRFGSDVFIRRDIPPLDSASRQSPIDVPIGPDYVLGAGDGVVINLSGGVSQVLNRTVDREGKIALPESGPLVIAGLSLDRAQQLIETTLKQQFRNVRADVTIARLRTVRIYVVGDVQRPGAYDVSSLSTPLNALYAAGGPTGVGSLRVVRHYRGQQLIRDVDLYDFLLHGLRMSDERLLSGDTLLIPPAGPEAAVFGSVKRPAIYELKNGETLAGLLEDAGGATVAAALNHISIDRIQPNRQRETVSLNLTPGSGDEAIANDIAAFKVKDGDRIQVAPILPYSERAIYVEGHVIRPGKLAYRDGMELNDVLHSYQDLLPEPAAKGDIVRLVSPDLHAETIQFEVADVLIGNTRLSLRPFDTVRIYGRYEVDSPQVTVRGEVLRPGTYALSQGMTAAGLVRMAGGFKRDALLETADLTSYSVTDGSKIVSERSSIQIGSAIRGQNANIDVPLKPGDILTIHQISGWSDIGASVTINGEATYPGSYGLQEGERLSSVLRRAGGLRTTAYPDGAVLIRQQVKQLEDKSREELIRQIETTSASARLAPNLSGQDETALFQAAAQQQNEVLQRLRNQPAAGRLVIHINADINSWANTAADIELRSGDVLNIPKRPGFVLVSGQVYNASAITFVPGKSANWYLQHAGGTNEVANNREIFVVRANGSVVGKRSGGIFSSPLSTKLDPGDVIVVPQKIIGGSLIWRNLLTVAQITSSIAITAAVAGVL